VGDRPLFVILLRKHDSLAPMADAIQQGFRENKLLLLGEIQLAPAPAKARPVRVTLEAPDKITRSSVKLPQTVRGDFLSCPEASDDALPLNLRVTARPESSSISMPSVVRVQSIRNVETPAKWVLSKQKPVQDKDSVVIPLSVKCASPGMFSTEIEGRLKMEIATSFAPAGAGWWIDVSTADPWQYPYKAYKLSYLVDKIHQSAVARNAVETLQVDLGLKVSH
jgi:hypothetical protein